MFMGMGFVHIVAGFLCFLIGSDASITYSQLIGGFIEFNLGLYWYLDNGEVV